MLKISLFLRIIQTLRVNNSGILTIKNAKFSRYYFYMNLKLWEDFQNCISVPLTQKLSPVIQQGLVALQKLKHQAYLQMIY